MGAFAHVEIKVGGYGPQPDRPGPRCPRAPPRPSARTGAALSSPTR